MTAARIEASFARLGSQNKAAFVGYVMAGDPDLTTCAAILRGLPRAGADIIELGLPFSDPVADGPTIQRAAIRALKAGMNLAGALALVRDFRDEDQVTPIVLMGYLNPLLTFGLAEFAKAAALAGADGVIIVDCPPEEAAPLAEALDGEDLALIRLATPTTDESRLKIVASRTRGFVYYVSVTGVTGAKEADAMTIAPLVEKVRQAGGLPVAVGFGIRSPERAAEVARIADAAVVGSALVDEIEVAVAQNRDPVAKLLDTAANIAMAVHAARESLG